MSRARPFLCNCCGVGFVSSKPQDPERDRGYGTCEDCRESAAKEVAKVFCVPIEEARKRLAEFA